MTAQCGHQKPGDDIGCTLPQGHRKPIRVRSNNDVRWDYDHANTYYGQYWHESGAVRTEVEDPLEILSNLAERLRRASRALQDLSEVSVPEEAARLSGRASGVSLALSYVEEEIRMRKNG